jgi:excisionase family DNA binding protein
MAFVLIDERALAAAENVLTAEEAAHLLGCKVRNVRALVQTGRLPSMRFKTLTLIPVSALERLLAQRRANPELYARRVEQARRIGYKPAGEAD